MARVKRGVTTHARHQKVLTLAKGYRCRSSDCYRPALEKVEKALRYAYRDRRAKKRDFRSLWIQRINAGARLNGLTYSQLINGLNKANINIDRKMLADIAVKDAAQFSKLCDAAKKAAPPVQKAA